MAQFIVRGSLELGDVPFEDCAHICNCTECCYNLQEGNLYHPSRHKQVGTEHGAAEERGIRWGNSQLCGDQIEVLAEVQAQLVVQAQLSTAITTMKPQPQDQLQLAKF